MLFRSVSSCPTVRPPSSQHTSCLAYDSRKLANRGRCWFERGALKIHLGVEKDFHPARKAHPALEVKDLPQLIERLRERGHAVKEDEPLEGYHRVYVDDPFGNRIELLEPVP